MGSLEYIKKGGGGRRLGKIDASLGKKLAETEWGEYRPVDVFDVKNTSNILSKDIKEGSGETPYLCASAENNAVSSYIAYDEKFLEKGNCIFIGGKTFVVTYQEDNFFSNDSHNLALYLKTKQSKSAHLFLAACIKRSLGSKYSWGNSISNAKIQNDIIKLPTRNGEIDFAFMEEFIAEPEAYLAVTGLKDYKLTPDEGGIASD